MFLVCYVEIMQVQNEYESASRGCLPRRRREEEEKKKYHLMFKPTSLNVMMMGAICLLMYLVYQTI